MGASDSLPERGWRNFSSVFGKLRPPLRPAPSDVDNFKLSIGGERRVLLLGVTPELSRLGRQLTAIDNSPRMVAQVWPGDSPGRRGLVGDWTALPFADESFDAVIGDASLNAAPEQVDEVLAEVQRVLAREGNAAFRLFCAPEHPETLRDIEEDVEAGWSGNLHALKWRIAMSIAHSKPRFIVPVQEILEAFNRMFPDRGALAAATGWPLEDIGTLDAYAGADHSLGFPTLSAFRTMLERHFSKLRVLPGSGYPLAERCPVVMCSR